MKELRRVGYEPYSPPRLGLGVGTIITYDKLGREVLVARPESCFPTLVQPKPNPTELLASTEQRLTKGGFSASAAQLSKDVADLSFALEASSDIGVDLKFIKPFILEIERIKFEPMLRAIDQSNPCYREILDPKNVLVWQVMGVEGLQYTFKDKADNSVSLSATVLSKAKVAPELSRKVEGTSALTVSQPILLGYKALEVRLLPAAAGKPRIDVRDLTQAQVDTQRQQSMAR
ncbi:MAG: hypothetical protein SFV15_07915 [Polyangiaceae bacterium]|nr:hypothetical protein [Polyangiaceae bacterium]